MPTRYNTAPYSCFRAEISINEAIPEKNRKYTLTKAARD